MKFARCNYASFEDSKLDLKMYKGNLFFVTEEIERSRVFIDGLNTKNFELVEITTLPQLRKVVNLTESIENEFIEMLESEKEPEPEDQTGDSPDPDPVPEQPPEPEKDNETAGETTDVTDYVEKLIDADEQTGEGSDEEEKKDDETPEFVVKDLSKITNYGDLQAYALEVEQYTGIDINRSAKTGAIKKAIVEALAKKAGE